MAPGRGFEHTPAGSDCPLAVDVRSVSLTFETSDGKVDALQGIDLKIAQREFVSFIGPSGCGKTTLLRIIADLEQPTAGSVVVNGMSPGDARQRRDCGYIFQAPALYPWRTIEKNVMLPLEVMGFSRDEQRKRAQRYLALVNLAGFERKFPWQLSGGMQQRVAIARALALDPAILLMDEPFGALDEMTRERMNLELHRIWSQTGTTVIFVTHSIPEAVFLSMRVVVMSARPGRISRVIPVDLPRERTVETREMERYFQLVTEVREALRGYDVGDSEAGDGRTSDELARVRAEGASG